jgi:hypothetical protein
MMKNESPPVIADEVQIFDVDYRVIPEGDQLRVRLDLQPMIKRQALAG